MQYVNFSSLEELQSFFGSQYIPLDICNLGDLCAIQMFSVDSTLYDFDTAYKGIDITGNYQLIKLSSFDIQRNPQRVVFTNRQTNFINKTVSEYLAFYNEIKYIYVTGIYSPCYAEPGWSENTWYLAELRKALETARDTSQSFS